MLGPPLGPPRDLPGTPSPRGLGVAGWKGRGAEHPQERSTAVGGGRGLILHPLTPQGPQGDGS